MPHSESESKNTLSVDDFSREFCLESAVVENLERYLNLLIKWQKRFNLVGARTLGDPWRRHFMDSAQLKPFLMAANGPIIDMGSGAGFPGLVLSVMGAADVHLIESDANKTEFLRQIIRETGASAAIHRTRLEQYDGPKATRLTSRACAPLGSLLNYGEKICQPDTSAVFLKGKTWRDELTSAQSAWHIENTCHPSLSDTNGIVLEIHEFNRR